MLNLQIIDLADSIRPYERGESKRMENKIKPVRGGKRDSSIELFRIITMLCIVAHHYVVNSGILQEITRENVMTFPSLFSLLFGWGGKTGIKWDCA